MRRLPEVISAPRHTNRSPCSSSRLHENLRAAREVQSGGSRRSEWPRKSRQTPCVDMPVLSLLRVWRPSRKAAGSCSFQNSLELAILDKWSRYKRKIKKLRINTIDRKSTRLNSSHRTISYAVFCLKKKKKKKITELKMTDEI